MKLGINVVTNIPSNGNLSDHPTQRARSIHELHSNSIDNKEKANTEVNDKAIARSTNIRTATKISKITFITIDNELVDSCILIRKCRVTDIEI